MAVPPDEGRLDPVHIARASSGFIRDMSNSHLLIPGRHIQLLETVGQGGYNLQHLSPLHKYFTRRRVWCRLSREIDILEREN